MAVGAIEEIAYRNRPPLLEDASIRGPTRTPVPGSMLTLEERDAIEADFRWYRYSKFALPWLILLLALAIAVWGLTAWYQVGDIKDFHALGLKKDLSFTFEGIKYKVGIPMEIIPIAEIESSTEAGIPKKLRNLRIAYVWIAFFAIIATFLTLFMKPRPRFRTILNYLWVFLFLAACVLAAISFAWGIDNIHTHHCKPNRDWTFERCEDTTYKHAIQIVADIFVAVGSLLCFILLAFYTVTGDFRLQRAGWRERERDAQQEMAKQSDPAHLAKQNIRRTRITYLSILLLFTLAATIISAVFIVYIHLDRDERYIQDFENGTTRGRDFYRISGWPSRSTRMRYAACTIVILAILVNFIPFVHRLIAYIFAFLYTAAAVVLFVNFGFDIHELHKADRLACPSGFQCRQSPYIATAILEFLLALFLVVYVCWEFILKCLPAARSIHSRRHYALHEIAKHDEKLDSFRPVRCEVTGRVMPAKEYVYRWRFIAGTPAQAAYEPLYPVMPLFSAEGYAPGLAPAGLPVDVPVAYDPYAGGLAPPMAYDPYAAGLAPPVYDPYALPPPVMI